MNTILSRFVRSTVVVSALASSIATPYVLAAPTPGPAVAGGITVPGTLAPINKSTPEFDAFRKAWDGLSNYKTTIVAHESTNDGKATQDRTYRYQFAKPSTALIVVIAGPGKGGGAAWHGGSTVHGHKGGLVSFVKLTVPKDDPRVTSLRGDQIEVASYGYELDRLATVPGTLSETKTPAGTVVTFVAAAPDRTGITKEILTFSPLTHLPIRHEAYVGERSVKNESFSDLVVNDPNLKAATMDI